MRSPAENASVVISLPVALLVVYALAIVVWYELMRSLIAKQVDKRRANRARVAAFKLARSEDAEMAQRRREGARREAAEEAEPDPARRHYYLARKAAKAERDMAVETANLAAKQAVERIERRYREIDAGLDDEEDERIRAKSQRP